MVIIKRKRFFSFAYSKCQPSNQDSLFLSNLSWMLPFPCKMPSFSLKCLSLNWAAALVLKTKGHWSLSSSMIFAQHFFFLPYLFPQISPMLALFSRQKTPILTSFFGAHGSKNWWCLDCFLFTCMSVQMDMKFAEVAWMGWCDQTRCMVVGT